MSLPFPGSADNFYPRSPCGERRRPGRNIRDALPISIHALLAESDSSNMLYNAVKSYFYPRSPCGERHLRVLDGSKSSIISIHALLAESDREPTALRTPHQNFYPRSPCGERLYTTIITICIASFLSTLSLRRATLVLRKITITVDISIHALLAESDL